MPGVIKRPRRAPARAARLFQICLACAVLCGGVARAAPGEQPDAAPRQGDAEIAFAIPVQPLGSALAAFGAATGFEIVADARLARGRMSSPVIGTMLPREALLVLLTGTGLSVRNYTPGSAKIVLAPVEPDFSPSRSPHASYFAAVQHAVLQAACGSEATTPGGYRLAIKLWITASGAVTRAQLLDTSGDRERDAALIHALQRSDIGRPLPAGFEQPITLVIRPRMSGNNRECGGANAAIPRPSGE